MAEGDDKKDVKEEETKVEEEDGNWMDGMWAVGFVLVVVGSMGASWYMHR
eukprot:CAMPEP_0177252812 /NCGR_PEP_ID=MMETSP0367-20130122/54776_1 /TAXON_ID=447022 ORGANISM="Scrippsiella hangoei-like, Strain SHHI-4" /NCGR_SAMPLE_ID=MMETSP0367 /ASSEMBLY_ACC=CAM_ASM_000362 /LENGTH=49 /DNA_ID=CAMNT_0018705991 /DNA_START=14 /DNA_END=163 /DNA_ORIENTATION=-